MASNKCTSVYRYTYTGNYRIHPNAYSWMLLTFQMLVPYGSSKALIRWSSCSPYTDLYISIIRPYNISLGPSKHAGTRGAVAWEYGVC